MTSVLLIDLNKRKNRTRILPKHGLFMYTSTWIYKLPIQLYLTYVKLIVSALSEVEITLKLDVCGFFLLDLNKARTTHNHSLSHRKAFHWGKRDSEVDFWQGTSYFWCSPVCTRGCMHVLQCYFCVCGLRWCDDECSRFQFAKCFSAKVGYLEQTVL